MVACEDGPWHEPITVNLELSGHGILTQSSAKLCGLIADKCMVDVITIVQEQYTLRWLLSLVKQRGKIISSLTIGERVTEK